MSLFNKPKLYLLILSIAPSGAILARVSDVDLAVPLNFETALHWAIEADPRLRRVDAHAEAADGQIEQADLPPNPVVGAEAENFLGTGPYGGIDYIEVTLGISQVIETAGKREKRTDLARRERESIDWAREQRLAEVEAEVRQAFVAVLLSQETKDLRQEQLELAQRSESETARLVEVARAPLVELTRAQLAVQQQGFELQKAENAIQTARSRLAARCNLPPDAIFDVAGMITVEETVPDLNALFALLPETASLARYDSIENIRKATVELEQAMASPDLEVIAGGRYFNGDKGQMGFVAGIQIPWPLYDKNQGNIRTAKAQLRAIEYERDAIRRELIFSITTAYQNLVSAHSEARSVRKNLIPGAKQTLADTEKGYEKGQFNLLAVLESRMAWFEAREAYLDAISRYSVAQATIQSLTRPAEFNQ